jgi:hypothetical protein
MRPRIPVPSWASPALFAVVAAIGMALRLFIPVPVGMANNNDGERLMCQVGADAGGAPDASSVWRFTRFWYRAVPPGTKCSHYPSTQLLPLKATAWIHQHVLRLPGAIDMREVMLEYCLLVGSAIAVTSVLLATINLMARITVLAALWIVLADATFADYAASPFSESAALTGLLIFAIAAVAVVARTRWHRTAYLAAWFGAVMAVGAKNQMVTLALPLAVFFMVVPLAFWRLQGRVASRVIPALCVITLAATAGWNLAGASTNSSGGSNDKEINFANELTMTIMPLVADPGEAAVGLGLPRSFGQYSGTNWWSPKPIENDPLYPNYRAKFTPPHLLPYLAKHPILATRVLANASKAYFSFRNDYLGTYPVGSGHGPSTQECRVCLAAGTTHFSRWSGFPGLLVAWGGSLIGTCWLLRRSGRRSLRRGFASIALVLLGCVAVQYPTAAFGDGNEVAKHLVIAMFAAALVPVFLLASAIVAKHTTEAVTVAGDVDDDQAVLASV